jgi:hypothetical protein
MYRRYLLRLSLPPHQYATSVDCCCRWFKLLGGREKMSTLWAHITRESSACARCPHCHAMDGKEMLGQSTTIDQDRILA